MKLMAKSDDMTVEVELCDDCLDTEGMRELIDCFGELVKVVSEAL